MRAASDRFGDYEIRSEPTEAFGDYTAHWFGVYKGGRTVFTAEVRASNQVAAAQGAVMGEEGQTLAERLGGEWIRARLGGASFIQGLRYLVSYRDRGAAPAVEVLGRLSD